MSTLYCKNRENKTVKVWEIIRNMDNGQFEMHKYKPHLMGSKANIGFEAYATQLVCFRKKQKGKPLHLENLHALFSRHPEVRVIINDRETGMKFESHGIDWTMYGRKADYGDGEQLFLDIKMMKRIL